MYGNKFGRLDTRPKTFKAWDLPEGAKPHRLMVDRNGQVWYTGRWWS
jgi:streptogramin lyase